MERTSCRRDPSSVTIWCSKLLGMVVYLGGFGWKEDSQRWARWDVLHLLAAQSHFENFKIPELIWCTTTTEVQSLFVLHYPSGLAQDRLVINTQMCDSCPCTDTEAHSIPCLVDDAATPDFHWEQRICKMNSSCLGWSNPGFCPLLTLWWYGKSPTWDSLCFS